jgi:hypothetical protein
MTSLNIMGGLGNQLFQIATTYAYAKDNNFEYGFDLSKTLLPLQGHPAIDYIDSLYQNLPQINHGDYLFNDYHAPSWEYSPIPPKDNMILNGYFQSPKYFDHRRTEICDLFLKGDIVSTALKGLLMTYHPILRESISVHVRRGDYIKFPNIHPMLDIDYYVRAIDLIIKTTGAKQILIFSDDIEWCKNNFKQTNEYFIEGLTDVGSLCLMSLCAHHVIANSSFSWWGSYLTTHVNKVVVAPKKWFGNKCTHTWESIYRNEMILL